METCQKRRIKCKGRPIKSTKTLLEEPFASTATVETLTEGWLVQDLTPNPSGDLISTIRGSGAHPGRGFCFRKFSARQPTCVPVFITCVCVYYCNKLIVGKDPWGVFSFRRAATRPPTSPCLSWKLQFRERVAFIKKITPRAPTGPKTS